MTPRFKKIIFAVGFIIILFVIIWFVSYAKNRVTCNFSKFFILKTYSFCNEDDYLKMEAMQVFKPSDIIAYLQVKDGNLIKYPAYLSIKYIDVKMSKDGIREEHEKACALCSLTISKYQEYNTKYGILKYVLFKIKKDDTSLTEVKDMDLLAKDYSGFLVWVDKNGLATPLFGDGDFLNGLSSSEPVVIDSINFNKTGSTDYGNIMYMYVSYLNDGEQFLAFDLKQLVNLSNQFTSLGSRSYLFPKNFTTSLDGSRFMYTVETYNDANDSVIDIVYSSISGEKMIVKEIPKMIQEVSSGVKVYPSVSDVVIDESNNLLSYRLNLVYDDPSPTDIDRKSVYSSENKVEQLPKDISTFSNSKTSKLLDKNQNLKTYTNRQYGFELKYPSNLDVEFIDKTNSDQIAIFHVYDPLFDSTNKTGQDVRSEYNEVLFTVYPYTKELYTEKLKEYQSRGDGSSNEIPKESIIKSQSGDINVYQLKSGLVGDYVQGDFHNDSYIFEVFAYSPYSELVGNILSTFNFIK